MIREFAYEIVYGTMEKGAYSDKLRLGILKQNPGLSKEQRGFLKRLSCGAVERAVELDGYLSLVSNVPVKKMNAPVRTVLRMALYEILYMDQVPEAASCHEAVELLRKKEGERFTKFVNGVLRSFLRKKDRLELKYSWQRLSVPEDLMKHFTDCYGKKTAEKIGKSFLVQGGDVTLHIDTNRISPEEYAGLLREQGVSCSQGHYMEEALIVSRYDNVAALPGYRDGLFFVQDESSMLPVACAGISPGDTVVDVCGAPGGKTIHALMALRGTGEVRARDISFPKVRRMRENIARMKYKNVSCEVFDASESDTRLRGGADVVLVDVPCSGMGIIGRKPEIRYRALPAAKELVPVQRKICKSSAEMLRKGGVMMYSTCTMNPAENEENVRWMEEALGLRAESLDGFLPETLKNKMTSRGMLQMIPGVQKSDGFFVARMRKV